MNVCHSHNIPHGNTTFVFKMILMSKVAKVAKILIPGGFHPSTTSLVLIESKLICKIGKEIYTGQDKFVTSCAAFQSSS